jgi:hypothetical protein
MMETPLRWKSYSALKRRAAFSVPREIENLRIGFRVRNLTNVGLTGSQRRRPLGRSAAM